MKILISWIAFNNDFLKEGGNVDKNNSPNYLFHKHFYKGYDKHVILSAAKEDDIRINYLITTIRNDFTNHKIEECYMNVSDVIDLDEIKTKIESKLLEFSNEEIDIFFSPGTSIMQVVWYIVHTNLGLKTKLLQSRPASKSKSGQTELVEINTELSPIPITAIIKEKNISVREKSYELMDDFLHTNSIKSTYERAFKVAKTDNVTTLITGESGTGKEHLARFIHANSIRKKQQFLAINCSSLNDSLLESRLFGYLKGSFTGANEDKKGLFEQAEGGTIFLDEIGDISSYLQQSLLRVLQEKEVTPIGGKPKKINVRVIAATNKNLPQKCKNGEFRWDLFYRLAVVELELLTLQNRGKKEIAELLDFFLKKKKKELKKDKELKINKETRNLILNYSFPGNIRELENFIESLYVFCDNVVSVNDLPEKFLYVDENISLRWQDAEKMHILKVMKICNGNQRQTCLALGYGSINTLKNKMNQYGIDSNLFSPDTSASKT